MTVERRQTAYRMRHCCARRIVETGGRRELLRTSTRWAERQRIIGAEANRIATPNAATPRAGSRIPEAQRSFKLWTANLGLSLGGVRGIFSFEKENIPLCRVPTRCGARSSAAALHLPCALRAQKETALAGCFPPAPEARKLSKLSIWDTYPHFPSFFFG